MKFNGDIIVTDPCYLLDCDAAEEESGKDWVVYIGKNCMSIISETGVGDISGGVFKKMPDGTEQKIGDFCVDAGLFGVFDLNSIKSMKHHKLEVLDKDWCCTKIEGFVGEVTFEVDRQTENFKTYKFVGKGNFDWEARQTGW
jgi:hypothetical protein